MLNVCLLRPTFFYATETPFTRTPRCSYFILSGSSLTNAVEDCTDRPVTVVTVDLSGTDNASDMEYGDKIIPPLTQYIQMYGAFAYPGRNYKKPDEGVVDSR